MNTNFTDGGLLQSDVNQNKINSLQQGGVKSNNSNNSNNSMFWNDVLIANGETLKELRRINKDLDASGIFKSLRVKK